MVEILLAIIVIVLFFLAPELVIFVAIVVLGIYFWHISIPILLVFCLLLLMGVIAGYFDNQSKGKEARKKEIKNKHEKSALLLKEQIINNETPENIINERLEYNHNLYKDIKDKLIRNAPNTLKKDFFYSILTLGFLLPRYSLKLKKAKENIQKEYEDNKLLITPKIIVCNNCMTHNSIEPNKYNDIYCDKCGHKIDEYSLLKEDKARVYSENEEDYWLEL